MTAEVLRILALCLVATVAVLYLRRSNPEQAFLCALAAGVVIFAVLLRLISATLRPFSELFSGQTAEYFKVAVKALGIAYLTTFVADACRDFGQSALAAKAELGGRCAILLLCLPLLTRLLQIATELTKL